MKELKFRAYSKSLKRMLNHYLFECAAGGMYAVSKKKLMEMNQVEAANEMKEGIYLPTKDDDLIFMQYIGIKDKTGLEVYEGDVLQNNEGGSCFVIDFDKSSLGYKATDLYTNISYDLSDFIIAGDDLQDVLDGTIIGFVYENPEYNQ